MDKSRKPSSTNCNIQSSEHSTVDELEMFENSVHKNIWTQEGLK
jgi:hypothetical protein